MKPLNANEQGCDPISSNCVLWEGPDISCIKLCKGDSVSAVVHALATELCSILETLNVDTYDIACLEINNCGPEDFHALIQLLINKVCELEGVTPTTPGTPSTGGCPDCVVNIADCFYFTNPQGDQETTMQLTDYVNAIGNRICSIANQISTINLTLEDHETRIDTLENAPIPTFELPFMSPVCVLPSDPVQPIDVVLVALEKQFCELQTATGNPTDIYGALLAQCVGLNQSPQLQGSGTMQQIPDWNTEVTNLADGITNMWLTLCDIRASIQSIQTSCCTTTSCDDLDIEVQGIVVSPTVLKLFFTGTFPAGYSETNVAGSLVTITDSANNSITVMVPITANLNDPTGFSIDLTATPINSASNLIISVPLSYTSADGESQCDKVITDIVINDSNCPTLTLIPTETTIGYTFAYTGGAGSIDVKLYDVTGTTELSSVTYAVTGPQAITGSFVGLTGGTQYKVRIEITVDGAALPTLCPFGATTTSVAACPPPSDVSAILTILAT